MYSLLGTDQCSYIQELCPKFDFLHFYHLFISNTASLLELRVAEVCWSLYQLIFIVLLFHLSLPVNLC